MVLACGPGYRMHPWIVWIRLLRQTWRSTPGQPPRIPTNDPSYHVMMVKEDGKGVIGACDEAGQVCEYGTAGYAKKWKLRGFRRLPWPKAESRGAP